MAGNIDQKPLLDVDIEAALLSLDNSQLTQNMMQEFINARNDGLTFDGTQRKHSHQTANVNDTSANSRLESLI